MATRSTLLKLLTLSALGCVTSGGHHVKAATKPDQLAVVRVVGTALRDRLHGDFAVLPRIFIYTPVAAPALAPLPADEERALLDALRVGGSAQWADSAARRDSSRTVVTLAGPVVIDGDTARVPVYISAGGHRAGQPVFYTIEQFVIARVGAEWHLVRRRIIYAT